MDEPFQQARLDDAFLQAAWRMTDEEFYARYGAWDAMTPAGIAAELAGCGVPWRVAVADGVPDRPGRHPGGVGLQARPVRTAPLGPGRAGDRGISYLRPEVALLYKAERAEGKDRDDLAAARLTPDGRAWLAAAYGRLGYAEWAALLRSAGG